MKRLRYRERSRMQSSCISSCKDNSFHTCILANLASAGEGRFCYIREVKAFPLPGSSRWCIYLESNKSQPSGEIGHICISFKKTSSIFLGFYRTPKKIVWTADKCPSCREELPKDLKYMVKFLLL